MHIRQEQTEITETEKKISVPSMTSCSKSAKPQL